MYASPRYTRSNYSYQTSPRQTGGGYSPTSKYGHGSVYGQEDQRHQRHVYSPPMKNHSSYHHQQYQFNNQSSNSPYYQNDYYHSGSSTASSSQDGYYGDDMDDLDDYSVNPEMTTVPTVPTPLGLSLYEHGKTPSGRVLVTSGNQTVEFFSCVVNAPFNRCMYVSE